MQIPSEVICTVTNHQQLILPWALATLAIYAVLLVAYSLAGWTRHKKSARGSFAIRLGIELIALSGIAHIGFKMATGQYACVFVIEDYFILGLGLVVSSFLLLRSLIVLMSKPFRAPRGTWDPKTE
jgi:hypothetical protein